MALSNRLQARQPAVYTVGARSAPSWEPFTVSRGQPRRFSPLSLCFFLFWTSTAPPTLPRAFTSCSRQVNSDYPALHVSTHTHTDTKSLMVRREKSVCGGVVASSRRHVG